ncbi:flagellar export chaperone FliS [Thalassolituus maritimus]|jgi:flagellar protein FliS|uniref:Flagellar secretion chaperone FliS n=1 Tax=Thalassolituus maritimus TaxID=484498 RepID=A0ABQ0A296_9GAMM|nr:flagellar export chaperone FliS [Pseudomonadota bacterium]
MVKCALMFGPLLAGDLFMYQSGASQYQKVNVTSEVLDADPHRLIQLLMEAALTRMAQAKGAIQRKDMQEKASLLGRVNEIIQTLQSSLDHNQGGDLAGNLDRLYDYMVRRLLEASGKNSTDMIDEVMGLMLEVKTGWDGIRQEYLESVHGVRKETDDGAPGRLSSSVSA